MGQYSNSKYLSLVREAPKYGLITATAFHDAIDSPILNQHHALRMRLFSTGGEIDPQDIHPSEMPAITEGDDAVIAPLRRDCIDCNGSNGTAGAPGSPITEMVMPGNDGATGSSAIDALTHADFAKVSSLPYLQMVLRAAELDYLNRRYEITSDRLQWLGAVTQDANAVLNGDDLDGHDASWGRGKLTEVGLAGIHRRVTVLLRQLVLRFDYYGKPFNATPMLSLDAYQRAADVLLDIGESIENAYRLYYNEKASEDERVKSIRGAMVDAELTLQQLDHERAALLKQQGIIEKQLDDLAVDIDARWLELNQAANSFRTAVERRAACSFLDVLTAVATVVSVAAGGWKSVLTIQKALHDLDKLPEGQWEQVKYQIKQLKVIGESASSIADGFQKIKKVTESPTPGSPPLNTAKLISSQKDFEDEIRPYMNMPEAQEYRDAARRFFAVMHSHNAKVLEYNSVFLRAMIVLAEAAQTRTDLDVTHDLLSQSQNPVIGEFASFMGNALGRIRAAIVRLLHDGNRAFNYWALSDSDFGVTDYTIAHLRTTQAIWKQRTFNARENIGRTHQTFKNRRFDATGLVSDSDWTQFKKSGRLTLDIPRDVPTFAAMSHLLVDRIRVWLPGARTRDDVLQLSIVHSGVAAFYDLNGTKWEFVHEPRRTLFSYRVKDGQIDIDGDLGSGTGEYIGLSPLGVWNIVVDPRLNKRLQLERVSRIELEFDGRFLH